MILPLLDIPVFPNHFFLKEIFPLSFLLQSSPR